MATTAQLQIGLRIAGTKQRRAGFAPLASVGVLAGNEGNNMDRVTLVGEKPTYIIKHTHDYVLYMLIDRRVKSFDADADGVLSIAITIGRNAQLANGLSPYTLLNDVYKQYKSKYMTPMSDGRDSFLDMDADSEEFRAIVKRYPLEERKTPYVEMAAEGLAGIVCVPQDKMADFFRDTQYKEFNNFTEIQVGSQCEAMQNVPTIQIPRPESYEVWVNGKPTGEYLSDLMDSYTTEENELEYANASFTLAEVKNAKGGALIRNDATICLEPQRSRILCDLQKKEVIYTLQFEWQGATKEDEDNIKKLMANKNIKLFINGDDISLFAAGIKQGARMKEQDAKNCRLKLTPEHTTKFNLAVTKAIDHVSRNLTITITLEKRAAGSISSGSNSGPNRSTQNGPLATTQPDNDFNNGNYNQQNTQPEKQGIDLKSLLIGLIIGLILGIGGTLIISEMMGEKEKAPEAPVVEGEKEDVREIGSPIDSTAIGETATDTEVKVQEEADRKAKEEADKKAKEEADRKAKEEADKKAKEEADRKAKEAKKAEEKAQEALDKAQQSKDAEGVKATILKMVNDVETIAKIREKWGGLNQDEKYAIETIYGGYKSNKTPKGKPLKKQTIQKIQKFLESKKKYVDWNDLLNTRQKIIEMIGQQDKE